MTIAKKVEEFKKLANESFARGGFLTTDYPGMAGVNEWELDPIAILAWLEASLREHGESEYKRGMEDGELEILRERQREGLKHIDELLKS